jgi:hypothetical protein
MLRHLFMICLFLLSSLFLFLQANNQFQKISIEEVLSIGDIDDDLIYQWAGLTTDEEGNIYLTDLKDYSIKKFNKRGQLLEKTGKKGQGPGDFNSPVIIKYFDGKLYVSEIYKPGIQVFDNNLIFLYAIPIMQAISDFGVVSSDEVAISGFRSYSKEEEGKFFISFYDARGQIKKKIEYATNEDADMLNMIDFCIDKNKNIVFVYTWKDRVGKIDQAGKQIFTKSLLGIKKPKTKKSQFGEFPTDIIYKAVDIDQYGNIFILGGDLSKIPSRDVYVLNPDGKYICTFTLPESSHTIHIDNENFLYSRANEGVTLKKYSIKYALK